MSKFKVGDRVRILHTAYIDCGLDAGTVHEVSDIEGDDGVRLRGAGPANVGDELYFYNYEIEHATTRTLTVGEAYTSHNGYKWLCIAVDGDLAWMRAADIPTSAAYTFKTDGTNISQGGGGWDVKFEPVVEWVDTRGSWAKKGEAHPNYYQYGLRFPLIDGKPDWSQATVTQQPPN